MTPAGVYSELNTGQGAVCNTASQDRPFSQIGKATIFLSRTAREAMACKLGLIPLASSSTQLSSTEVFRSETQSARSESRGSKKDLLLSSYQASGMKSCRETLSRELGALSKQKAPKFQQSYFLNLELSMPALSVEQLSELKSEMISSSRFFYQGWSHQENFMTQEQREGIEKRIKMLRAQSESLTKAKKWGRASAMNKEANELQEKLDALN